MNIFLFYSYSHKDEIYKNELQNHLSVLKKKGYLEGWSDREITPGAEWKEEINLNLQKANMILLLVSSDFLASDYCSDTETIFALEQHEKGNAIVVPIIVRPCLWLESDFKKLQALPKDGKPVTKWDDEDEAWLNVSQGILDRIELIKSKKIQPEKNDVEDAFVNAVDENHTNNVDDSTKDLKSLLIHFLKTYYSFYFSPLRIQQWGSKQLGFKYLKNYSTKEIKEELEILLKINMVKTILSKKGNMIYKIISR